MSAVACRMTRAELQKRLAESAFGRNEVMFDAYFKWDSAERRQPRCAVCFQPIGLHGDGAAPEIATPAPAAPPPASAPMLVAPPTVVLNQVTRPPLSGYIADSTYEQMVNGTSSIFHQPAGLSSSPLYTFDSGAAHPPPQQFSPSRYQPPVVVPAAYAVSMSMLPSGVVNQGAGVDVVVERYANVYLVLVGIFLLLCVASLATSIGVLTNRTVSFGNDDSDASSANRGDGLHGRTNASNPWSYTSVVVWGLAAGYFAFRCRRFECRITKGVSVETVERRLLTHCAAQRTSIAWDDVDPANIEAFADSNSAVCCCTSPHRCVIALRARGVPQSAGNVVRLTSVSHGLVDLELRAWGAYFLDALRLYHGQPSWAT